VRHDWIIHQPLVAYSGGTVAIKQYLLFTAPSEAERKMFIASFESSEDAVNTARKLKGNSPMRWQVIDSVTAACVAEYRGEINGARLKLNGARLDLPGSN
jgi:hypothetical protein